jgi:hypothetical protein
MNKKDKREMALFEELQTKYGYTVFALRQKDERFSTRFRPKGKKLTYAPVVCMKLAVSETSVMGREMKKLYDSLIGPKAKTKAPRPSRAKRAALSPKEKQDRDQRSVRGARMP